MTCTDFLEESILLITPSYHSPLYSGPFQEPKILSPTENSPPMGVGGVDGSAVGSVAGSVVCLDFFDWWSPSGVSVGFRFLGVRFDVGH